MLLKLLHYSILISSGQYLRCLRYAVPGLVEASLGLVVSGLVEPDVLLGESLKSTHCDAKNTKKVDVEVRIIVCVKEQTYKFRKT